MMVKKDMHISIIILILKQIPKKIRAFVEINEMPITTTSLVKQYRVSGRR